ncbi:uncharacterized protein PFL1_03630 [Pseudozyma flocculosa PF-1]|uniref:Uncharacterized protein n=2 Tax=Pseudozyma flocculosa TaxID=84751 RepID=A0A5C3F4E1_9BASI|nr:uncharacterized protein PFL1_03630 [Pseudozyma flocculosa PF-1]EPQ28827.1 hypothetical protein PFL1_03630 [Pseudozyma flocculosa PF-1]SPO39383.1 uncharacterized protein PSFLO_04864 [Pseudozyma flocculosa]
MVAFVAVLLVLSAALYLSYDAYIKRVHAQRARQFALWQRRSAGIPDSDTRPFGIARADALKKIQEQPAAPAAQPRASPLKPGSPGGTRKPTASPRRAGRSSPLKKHPSESPLAVPGYLQHRKSNKPRSPRIARDEPRWPGAFVEDDAPAKEKSSSSPTKKASTALSPHNLKHKRSDTDPRSGSPNARQSKKKSKQIAEDKRGRRTGAAPVSKKQRDGHNDNLAAAGKRKGQAQPQQLDDGSDSDLDMDESSPPRVAAGLRGKKRDVGEVDSEESAAGVSTRAVYSKKRGKARNSPASNRPKLSDLEYQLEDEEMASLSDFGAHRIETDRESLVDAGSRPRTGQVKSKNKSKTKGKGMSKSKSKGQGKREVDMSDDHEPGDEWTDLNGLQWRIGEDGVRRRATVVVEMRPKYNMPKDSQHPDAQQKIQVYVERFLSEQEFDEAKAQKRLGFQEAERQLEAEAKRKAAEEAAARAAERAAVSREVFTPKKLRNPDLLFSDVVPPGAARSGVDLKRSAGTPPRQGSTPSRQGTPTSMIMANKRISLSVSKSAGPSLSNSPSSRTALDAESKRRREEALMRRLREEKEAKEAAARLRAPAIAAPSPIAQNSTGASSGSATATPISASASSIFPATTATTASGADTAKPAESTPAGVDSKPSFSFGAAPAVSAAPPTPPIGGATTATATTTPAPATAPSFSFGEPKTEGTANTPSSSSPAFGAGASDAAPKPAGSAATSTPAFTFGAPATSGGSKPAASSTFTFGSSSATAPAANGPGVFTFGASSNGNQSGSAAPSPGGFTFSIGKK